MGLALSARGTTPVTTPKTGNLEEPPGLDNLPVYQLKIIGDDVIVALPDEVQAAGFRT